MDDEKFVGFDANTIFTAISVSLKFSDIIKKRETSMMGYEDTNSNISIKLSTDNDSGYMSQHVESNSVSDVDDNNVPTIGLADSLKNIYVDEDALLEKPQISKPVEDLDLDETNEEFEEFGHLYYMNSNSYVESSVVSQKTTLSGFDSNESGISNVSNIIPIATPLVLDCSNSVVRELENDPNYVNINNSNVASTLNNICDKSYEQVESNSNCLIDDNYTNSLSFSSALCELYDKGFGDSGFSTKSAGQLICIDGEESSQSPCIKSYIELKSKNKQRECSLPDNSPSSPIKPPKLVNPELSPELFSDDEASSSFELNSASSFQLQKNIDKKNVVKNDRLLIKRLQESLGGVPPPPSVTIIQMTIDEMLEKIKTNDNLFIKDSSKAENMDQVGSNEKSLLVNCKKEDFKEEEWPNLMKYRYHGLHFNRSKVHEDFEYMCVRYAERYIGAETQSSCTVFGIGSVCSSPSKRRFKFRRLAKSPGKRLSHLARRRITFSKDSLQSTSNPGNNSFIGSRTRQIMIDARKSELLSRRHSPFKKRSPLKVLSKSPQKKTKTPSSSAKKRYAMRLRRWEGDDSFDSTSSVATSCSSRASSTKRALFQNSPNKVRSTNGLLRLFGADTSETKLAKRKTPRRALFPSPVKTSPAKPGAFGVFASKRRSTPRRCLFSPDKSSSSSQGDLGDKKRKRIGSEGEPPLKFVKNTSLNSSNESIGTRKTSANGSGSIQVLNMAEHRKKKLMWAVAEALRTQNVDLKHPQFKMYASILARLIRYYLPNLFINGPRPEGSTTENMLRMARQHVFAVTRGKTLDQIIQDTKNAQLKPNKPSGYVALDKVLTESAQVRNKDNILCDRGVGVDAEPGCSKDSKKENLERIRRVIDFNERGGTDTKR